MKLETLIGIVIMALVILLSVVDNNLLTILGCFSIGWQIPTMSRAIANSFRKRNA